MTNTNIPGDAMKRQVEELLATARTYREKRDVAGLKFAEEAYELAKKMRSTALTIDSLRARLGFIMAVQANYAAAEQLISEGLELADELITPEAAGLFNNMMGICCDVKGDYARSRDCYLTTIKLLENIELTRDGKIMLANAYHNLVKLYMQIEVEDKRHDYLEKAEKLFESVGEMDGVGRIWNMRAGLLPDNASPVQRLEIFKKAFQFIDQGSDNQGKAICLANIGLCNCRMGNFEEGIPTLLDALEGVKASNNAALTGFTLFQVGEAYRLKGNNLKALVYLEEAEEVLNKANAKTYLNVVYMELATNLAALGRFKEAYEKQAMFIQEVNERIEFDRHAVAQEAKLKFELEKKEKESELLKKKTEEIELYNEKLQQSNEELNQFAYVASHDLKEPLRMVSNYMQLLEKSMVGKLNDDQSLYMRYASEGAKRMYKLIDSLLVFSRATMDTDLKLVDLNDVLDEVKRIVLSTVNKKVMLESDELPTISGDYSQMVQLFQNLISNAVKYNDKEEVQIKVLYTPQHNHYKITIEDNGIGIAPKHREQVFEIFRRLHQRDSYSGTGIGLSICKKIVHRANGKIWIEDSSLGGTAFVFSFPKKSAVV